MSVRDALLAALAALLFSVPAHAAAPDGSGASASLVAPLRPPLADVRADDGGAGDMNDNCLGLTWRAALGGTIGCGVGFVPSLIFSAIAAAVAPTAIATTGPIGAAIALAGMSGGAAIGSMLWIEGGMAGRWQFPQFWAAVAASALLRGVTLIGVALLLGPTTPGNPEDGRAATGAIFTMLVLPAVVEAVVLGNGFGRSLFAGAVPDGRPTTILVRNGAEGRSDG